MPLKTVSQIDYSPQDYYTAHDLNDVAALLGTHQIMKVYPKHFEQVEEKVRKYPLLQT